MLKITNLTNKTIDITSTLSLKPNNYLEVQTDINPRLYQLMNMGLIKIQEIKETEKNNNKIVTTGSLRRKQAMENIRKGIVKPSVPLDSTFNKPNQTKNNKNIRKNKNK